tara:strand:+ start:136 stop:468 length:333 start_codon:yes stop_codon:yes gene_type:complete
VKITRHHLRRIIKEEVAKIAQDHTLALGAKGPIVREFHDLIIDWLNRKDYKDPREMLILALNHPERGENEYEDMKYGKYTKYVVEEIQSQEGLAVDGIAGSETWARLSQG